MSKVALRKKPISGNRLSLYLDYYPPIFHPDLGKSTRREFLQLFLYDEVEHLEEIYIDSQGREKKRITQLLDKKGNPKKTKLGEIEKGHNKETIKLAEAIRAKRQLSIHSDKYGFLSEVKSETDFVFFFENLAKKRKGSNSDNWQSALKYLKNFANGRPLKFKELSPHKCDDFKNYLLSVPSRKSQKSNLSQNSAVSYFNKFKAALKQAYKEGYFEYDLNKTVSTIKQLDTERQFLTLEELQSLVNADCHVEVLKRAALFSALTGLRFSDIKKLVWEEIHCDANNGHCLRFRQLKTKQVETLPISDQAVSLLEKKIDGVELVFPGLEYSLTQTVLPKWLSSAGIKRNITFHSFRHTYATLLISNGIDLYTVSKMLGHREIKTTQVYAKIIDQKKRDAANAFKLKF